MLITHSSLKNRRIRHDFGSYLPLGVPMGIFQSMFSVVALERFQLPPDQNSYVMSYVGVMAMVIYILILSSLFFL